MQHRDESAFEPDGVTVGQRQTVMQRGGDRPREQSPEGAVSGRPFPKLAEQERREQRRVHEREDELQGIHDVVELRRHVRSDDGKGDSQHGRDPSHLQIVRIRRVALDVGLVDVAGPNGVERGHVARHPRHEAREQRRDAQTQQTGREVRRK